jgi:predicted acetyltransferase
MTRASTLLVLAAFASTLQNSDVHGVTFRRATVDDCALLAKLNHQLIRDEGHRNQMTIPELEQRMKGWLASEYEAALFENQEEVMAYALYREQPDEIYLRQLFVVRNQRRKGIGNEAVNILRTKIWPKHKRLTVEVLVQNQAAIAFWRAVGYKDYCLTLEILPGAKS